jgi:hypothetical protein
MQVISGKVWVLTLLMGLKLLEHSLLGLHPYIVKMERPPPPAVQPQAHRLGLHPIFGSGKSGCISGLFFTASAITFVGIARLKETL